MQFIRRSPALPVLTLFLLVVALAFADTPEDIQGEHEGPIIEKIREAIQLEEDAKSALGENPDSGDLSLADGKLDQAVEKIKEAVEMIDAVLDDSGKDFQSSTDAEGAKDELGSEPESGGKGKPTGAIDDDRKAQKKIAKGKPASRIKKSIEKGVDHKRTAILRMQGIRPKKGDSAAYSLPGTNREFGTYLGYTYDGKADKKLEVSLGYDFNEFHGLSIKWAKDKSAGGGYVSFTKKGKDPEPAAGFFEVSRRFRGTFKIAADLGVFTTKGNRMDPDDLGQAFVSIEIDKVRAMVPLHYVNLNVRYTQGGTQVFMNDHTGNVGNEFFSGARGGRAFLFRNGETIEGCYRPWGSMTWTMIGTTTALGNDGLGLTTGAGANGLVGKGELGIDNLAFSDYDEDDD